MTTFGFKPTVLASGLPGNHRRLFQVEERLYSASDNKQAYAHDITKGGLCVISISFFSFLLLFSSFFSVPNK